MSIPSEDKANHTYQYNNSYQKKHVEISCCPICLDFFTHSMYTLLCYSNTRVYPLYTILE